MTEISIAAAPARAGRAPSRSEFVAGRWYDSAFLTVSPLLALAISALLPWFAYPFQMTQALGKTDTRVALFISVWTTSHLVAVFFRSHLNRDIFAQHRFRFLGVPPILVLLLASAPALHAAGFVLAVLWDIYHSSSQNFGLCRIYDSKLGNDPGAGRRLDFWLNHVLYIGPIVAGLSLMATLEAFRTFAGVGWSGVGRWLQAVDGVRPILRWSVIVGGGTFLAFYLAAYARLVRGGYRISRQKVVLLLSVAVSSVWAWGFLPPEQAFFVANLYHALQYFAIVWWMERKNLRQQFHLGRSALGSVIALLAFAGVLALLGMGVELASNRYSYGGESRIWRFAGAAALMCSLVHFWYDGFIWSVRRKQV